MPVLKPVINPVINLLELSPELLLIILEILLSIDPITLLGSVPAVCKRLRALCPGVHGTFDLRNKWKFHNDDLDKWDGLQGALASVGRLFPRTRGLWTFSEFPLHDACSAGLLATTDALLKEDESKVNFEACQMKFVSDEWTSRYVTALYLACEKGHPEIVRLLVKKGADMDKTGCGMYTPLYMACQKGHLEIVQVLLEMGADINKSNGGWTSLDIACVRGHLNVVRFLVEKGADTERADDFSGCTPLFMACQYGHLDVARLLLEKGVDVNRADIYGETPLDIARENCRTEIISILEQAGAR